MVLSQKVAFNTLVQIIAKVVTVTFGLLTTIILTRYLGKAGFGDYIFVLTYVLLFGTVADWGTSMIGVREASENKDKQKEILGQVLLLRLGLSLLAAVLAISVLNFLPLRVNDPGLVKQAATLGALVVILLATKNSFGIAFQTHLRLEKFALTEIVISLLSFGLSVLAVVQGRSLLFLILAIILANLVGILLALFLAREMVAFSLKPNPAMIRYLVKEALPMGAVLIFFTVYNKIDTVMLAAIKGSQAVGIYGVAYRVHDVLVLGAAYFMQAMLPVLSACTDQNRLRELYQKAFDILLLMALPMLVVVLALAPLIVGIMAGPEFRESIGVLRILVLATFIAYFNHLTGFTIVALKKQRPYFLVTVAALIFNVLANLVLIPRFSYRGAAGVTIMTEGLVLVLTTVFIFRLLKIVPSLVKFPQTALEIVSEACDFVVKQKGKIF